VGCNCGGGKATAKKTGVKYTVKQADGTTKTFTNEADAKLSATKNRTSYRKV